LINIIQYPFCLSSALSFIARATYSTLQLSHTKRQYTTLHYITLRYIDCKHVQEALLGSLSQQLRHTAGRAYAGLRWSDGATAAAVTAGEESDMHCLRHPRLHYTRWLSRVLVERPEGADAALVRVFAAWTVGLKSPSMTLREQVCQLYIIYNCWYFGIEQTLCVYSKEAIHRSQCTTGHLVWTATHSTTRLLMRCMLS
jgi:hypothetical protein